MNRVTILHKGQKFEAQGSGRFVKDLVRVGEWVHPVTGKSVTFDDARITRLAANTNRYRAAENKIPYPAGHSTNPLDNMGDWPGPFFKVSDLLVGVVEPKDQVALQKMRDGAMDSVSVCIDFDFKDSKGNHYDEAITHVCATDYPVIGGQSGFLELSAEQRQADIYVPLDLAATLSKNPTAGLAGTHSRSTEMDLKRLALALGLAADAAPEKVVEAAEAKLKSGGDAATQLSALQTKLAEQLATHGMKLDGDKVTKLDTKPQTELEKRLTEELAGVQLDQAKSKIAAARATADSLVKEGKVPAAMQDRLARVFATVGKFESLSLSTNPQEVNRSVIDLTAELGALFSAIPSLTKERLSQLHLSTEELGSAQKEQEKLEARSKEIAARAQPAAAAK